MSLGQDGPPTTRTRLPEGQAGPGGTAGRRAAPRSSRNLVSVVGVIVLLIAAIAFANRGDGSDSSSGTGTGSGGSSKGSTQSQPTSATGEKPVSTAAEGIASGFADTSQGAQSAAANYAVALGGDGMFDTDRRHAIVAAVHDPAVADSLQAKLDKAYSAGFLASVGLNDDGSTPSGFTFVSRTIPVGTKTTGHSDTAATVEVWCTGLVGLAGEGSTKPVSQTWFTVTEQLKWVGGDWKIESSSQQQGPAPVSGDQRASDADEIANAVEGYGGFTYAR